MTEHKNIYTALAAAQAVMGTVVKGAVNPAFKSKYADLADVVAVVVPALSAQGIALHHSMSRDEHGLIMHTTLSHGASDTHIHCDVPLIVDRQNMQGMKSATTYAKRIGVESLTGIAPEDDDGNAAAKAPPVEQPRPRAPSDAEIAHDRAVTDALVEIEGCHDRDALTDVWKGLAPAVKADPRAVAASKARADLFKAQAAPIIDDQIKY